MRKPRVLFVCTHNSARSQMAEGLLRHYHGDRYEAFSAGTEATRVKPEAAAALQELGIDPSDQFSKTTEAYADTPMDYVVTVCDSAREACPYFPATRSRVHRSFSDPTNETRSPEARLEAFRVSRDEIRAWIDDVFRDQEPDFSRTAASG